MSSSAESPDPVLPVLGPPIPSWLEDAASRVRFYQELPHRGWPRFSHIDDDLVEAVARYGDPFAGRADPRHKAFVLIQATRDLPVYWALGRSDLRAMAESLATTWRALGAAPGDRVLLYDYSTSPLVAFASRSFLSHLDRGAADILSCTPICNDGLPELADRCAHILDYAAPSLMFIDSEAVEPLLDRVGSVRPRLRRIVVSSDETLLPRDRIATWREGFGIDVVQLLRSDAALLFAPPCPVEPDTFHPPSAFIVEAIPVETTAGCSQAGRISVTNTAVRSTVVARYVTPLLGRVALGRCRCGHEGTSVVIV